MVEKTTFTGININMYYSFNRILLGLINPPTTPSFK